MLAEAICSGIDCVWPQEIMDDGDELIVLRVVTVDMNGMCTVAIHVMWTLREPWDII